MTEPLRETWQKFLQQKQEWEERWLSLAPWLIGLDAGIIGVGISHVFDYQKEPWPFKVPFVVGLLLIAASFLLGLLFKKTEINLKFAITDELGKQYIRDVDTARATGGVLPPEGAESAREWSKAVKEVSKNQGRLQLFGDWTFYTFIIGVIVLGLAFILLIFRPEIQTLCENRKIEASHVEATQPATSAPAPPQDRAADKFPAKPGTGKTTPAGAASKKPSKPSKPKPASPKDKP